MTAVSFRLQGVFVKAEVAMQAVGEVMLQAQANTAKGEVIPRNFFGVEQCNFKTFLACGKRRGTHPAAVKKMNLIDVGDTDQRKSCVDIDQRAGFFPGFPTGCRGGRFAVFHESRR